MLKGKKAGLFYVEREGKAYEDKDLDCIGIVADEHPHQDNRSGRSRERQPP